MVDQLGVTAVDTVEHPDRENTSAPVGGNLVLTPPALHNASLRRDALGGRSRPPDQVMIA
jgi:hypothetical protein